MHVLCHKVARVKKTCIKMLWNLNKQVNVTIQYKDIDSTGFPSPAVQLIPLSLRLVAH